MRELLYKVFLPFMRRVIDDLDKPSAQLPLDSPFLADFMNKLNIKDVNATSPPASRQDAGSDEDEVELSEDESTQEDDDEPDEDEEPEDVSLHYPCLPLYAVTDLSIRRMHTWRDKHSVSAIKTTRQALW